MVAVIILMNIYFSFKRHIKAQESSEVELYLRQSLANQSWGLPLIQCIVSDSSHGILNTVVQPSLLSLQKKKSLDLMITNDLITSTALALAAKLWWNYSTIPSCVVHTVIAAHACCDVLRLQRIMIATRTGLKPANTNKPILSFYFQRKGLEFIPQISNFNLDWHQVLIF